MSLNFPSKPWTDGQKITSYGITYRYDGATSLWKKDLPQNYFNLSVDSEGAVPAPTLEGEMFFNLTEGVIYASVEDDNSGEVAWVNTAPAAIVSNSNGGTFIDYGSGTGTVNGNVGHLVYRLANNTDTDWHTETNAADAVFGSTAEVIFSVDGTRTAFDATTEIWMDGTTTTNQASNPSHLTITSYTDTSTNNTELEGFFRDVTGYPTAAGYTATSLSCFNQDRFGVFGFQDDKDYLFRFWFEHDDVGMSNNYTRLFGFTTCDITQTGSASSTVDPLFASDGFYVGTTNSTTEGRVVEDGTNLGNFTLPNSISWNTTGEKILATVSATYVSTGVWVCRLWLNNTLIDTGNGIDLTATNQHFQFGTGNSTDDRDGQHNVTHLQVDAYASGDMHAKYRTDTATLNETNAIYLTTPTEAYASTYQTSDYEKYVKIGEEGGNTAGDWLNVIT